MQMDSTQTAPRVVPYYLVPTLGIVGIQLQKDRMLHVSTRGRSASYHFRSHPAATRASHAGYMRLALSLNAATGTDGTYAKFLLHRSGMP